LKFAPLHPSVIYRYHATITIITVITPNIHANNLAILIIKLDAFATNVLLSAAT
jgi:hypothetical protein